MRQGILKPGDVMTVNYNDFASQLARFDYGADTIKDYLSDWADIYKNSKKIGILINTDGGITFFNPSKMNRG